MPSLLRSVAGLVLSACCFHAVAASAGRVPAAPDVVAGDILTATFAGEYALQAGRLDEASAWYLDAARSSGDDAGLAERATRIALLANQDERAGQALALWRARAPQSLAMRGAQATLAMRNGQARVARRELEFLLRAPGDEGWRYALAAMGTSAREPGLPGKLLGQLVDDDAIPNQLEIWLAFGGLAQHLDQGALAERIVQRIVLQFPDEPRVALLRASQLRQAGQPAAAAQVLAGLEQGASGNEELRLGLAAEYDALDQPVRAAAVLSRGPQDNRTYALRASLLAKAEDKAALGKLYVELQQGASEPAPDRRLLLGQVAEFLERYDQALAWYRGVPGGDERWQARLRAVSVLYKLDRHAEAYAELRVLQSDASVEDDARRDAYLLEASLREEDKDAAGELATYSRGLGAYPDDSALLYSRGLMWSRRDDIPRAEADLRKVLVAEPDNVAALNALGYTLADRTTRYREALELIDRARAAEPDSPAIIDSHGWVLYRLGRTQQAIVELRRALAMQKDAEIAAHLGEVLWMTGKRDEARRYFEEARALDADSDSLRRALLATGA